MSRGDDDCSPGPRWWLLMRQCIAAIDQVSRGVIIIAMASMTLMVCAQVFWRYALGSSIDSADEVSRLLFVWVIFLSIPHGIQQGVHVGIDIIQHKLTPAHRELLVRAMAATSALLMAAVMVSAWTATLGKWQELMPTLPVTAAVYYIPVLISAAHSVVHLCVIAGVGSSAWNDNVPGASA